MCVRTLMLVAVCALPLVALAQEEDASSIVPPDAQRGAYTTHKALPWGDASKPLPSPALLKLEDEKPKDTKAPAAKPKWLSTVPFGKPSSDVNAPLPKGPQMMQSVPVQGVDAIEVTEPAAPSTAPLEADPVSENPETPTEETAPIFSTANRAKPIKIKLRALNKVTGQSELIEARPGETVRFGKLDVTAFTCQTSDMNSQLDHAGFFEMKEQVPERPQSAAMFRGWMYASSPSITSLEHPIYDVTMVECISDQSQRIAAKKEEKQVPEPAEEVADGPVLD